jgi:hypothetical protein
MGAGFVHLMVREKLAFCILCQHVANRCTVQKWKYVYTEVVGDTKHTGTHVLSILHGGSIFLISQNFKVYISITPYIVVYNH